MSWTDLEPEDSVLTMLAFVLFRSIVWVVGAAVILFVIYELTVILHPEWGS